MGPIEAPGLGVCGDEGDLTIAMASLTMSLTDFMASEDEMLAVSSKSSSMDLCRMGDSSICSDFTAGSFFLNLGYRILALVFAFGL